MESDRRLREGDHNRGTGPEGEGLAISSTAVAVVTQRP